MYYLYNISSPVYTYMHCASWKDWGEFMLNVYIYIYILRGYVPCRRPLGESGGVTVMHKSSCWLFGGKDHDGFQKIGGGGVRAVPDHDNVADTRRARCKRLPGFNLQTSVVFGPATQKPQAACRPHAISAGAAVCHHGACSARPNHQGRRIRICASDRPEIHSRSTSPSPASKVVRSC